MNAGNPFNFSDDARLCLLQARCESLHAGSRSLGPEHVVLGVIKTISPVLRGQLFHEPAQFHALCTALGSHPARAPLCTDDIIYLTEAEEAIAGGIQAAAESGAETLVAPLHLLLGIHHPRSLIERTATTPSAVAAALTSVELGAERLRLVLERVPAGRE